MDDLKLYEKTDKGLDSLIQTVRIFRSDIYMQFGIEKCNLIIPKRGIKDENCDIMLPNDLKISSLKEGESYKYLGTLEAEDINTKKTKGKVETEYLRRTRKILESKLNSGNLFKATNTWVVFFFRYSAAFIDWTKEEISEIDRRTRKLLTMHKAHHPKDDIQRLYIKRKEGLISIEEFVEDAIAGLHHYLQDSEETLISVAWRSSGEQEVAEPPKITKQRWQIKRKQDWKNKTPWPVHQRY